MGDIYKVTSPEGKSYIGQAVSFLNNDKKTKWGAEQRWKSHIYEATDTNKERTQCTYLNNAINKYGADNFELEILYQAENLDELNEAEEYLIEEYNTLAPNGYNLRKGGNNKCWTEEIKQKIKNSNIGKKRSEETKTKLKKAFKIRQTKYSDSFVEEILQEFSNNKSVKEVAEQYDIKPSTIYNWLNGNRRGNRSQFDETLKEEAKTKKKTTVHNEGIKKQVLEELRQGVQTIKLVEKYNIPHQTISVWKKKDNIETRARVLHKDDIKVKVLEYIKQGHSRAETGRVFNVSSQTVSRWCLQNNI